MDNTTFAALAPSDKQRHLNAIYAAFNATLTASASASPRRGTTQGSAFLWINLYGKDPLTQAFARFLKKQGVRVIANYRGAKKAWFFGSQNDLGYYDGLLKANALLAQHYGLHCVVEDAWD